MFLIFSKFSSVEWSSVTIKLIFKLLNIFKASLHEFTTEFIVLKVYSIFGNSKILFLFWSSEISLLVIWVEV